MRRITIFLGFCLALTVALALPSPPIQHGVNRASESSRLRPARPTFNDQHLRAVITLRHLASLQPRDWFSDLIQATLNMTTKELLAQTEATFKTLDRVTKEGLEKLTQVIALATPEVQDKISNITETAIKQVFNLTVPFLKDLGLVLPNISSMKAARYDAAADIILALLGISLEDLVTAIANAMASSFDFLEGTIVDLKALAGEAEPNVGDVLIEISDSFLNEGQRLLIPMLNKLSQLVPIIRATPRKLKSFDVHTTDDMLDKTVSLMLGINILTASSEAEDALSKLINVAKSTRDVLNRTLAPEVQTKVMSIYDNAIDDVIRQAKPIFTILLQFQEPARHDHAFEYNLLNSILGIGLGTFKNYLRLTSTQIQHIIKTAPKEMFVESIPGGIMSAIDVWKIMDGKLNAAKLISQPFLDTLKPLLDSQQDEEEYADEQSDEWSNPDGKLFNRDALIKAASKLLNFTVCDATRELKIALEGLDSLMDTSLLELDEILEHEETYLRSEILEIMNRTLTNIHISVQPMFDVLLPFLPDSTRTNRDIALDIYRGINNLDGTRFLQYCSLAAIKIPQLTNEATYLIQTAASRASTGAQVRIINLLQRSDDQTKVILKPFLDSLGHIITPLS